MKKKSRLSKIPNPLRQHQNSEEMKEAPEDKSAKDWISTSRIAFDHSDIYPEILDLGKLILVKHHMLIHTNSLILLGTQPPSEEEIEKYKTPVTIYSDQKPSLTNLTVICSTPFQELKTTQKEIMRFGKHSEFSTPIKLIK